MALSQNTYVYMETMEIAQNKDVYKRQDYAQAVKNGDVFFGWSMWMEADGYSAGAPITFNFDNGSGTYTYHGKIAGSFVSADTIWSFRKKYTAL